MAAEAVYFEVDKEKTSVDAYNAFRKDVLMNFAEEEMSATDNRTQKLSKTDPNIAAQAAEFGAFFVKSLTAMMVYDYIKENFTSDDDGNTVYQTGDGPVYIEELNVMPCEEAEERVHNQTDEEE